MLRVEHITKQYGAFKALDDVSIEVRRGSIFGLLGPNGAGKTTLIRIVNRITQADAGEVTIDGTALAHADTRAIGYMPEERGLYKKMRVGEQALYLAQLKGMGRKEAESKLHEWFAHLDIEEWWNRKVEELSKGMQQKVQFIVTVVHEPKLLIFDEPFSGFDPVNATLLKNEILRLRDNGATVIFSTHNMSSVEEICDDIALINQAHVVLQGNVREIRQSHAKNQYHVEGELTTKELALPKEFVVERLTCNPERPTWIDADIRVTNGDVNGLVEALLKQCQLRQLQERLPSMNEVFINSVKNERP